MASGPAAASGRDISSAPATVSSKDEANIIELGKTASSMEHAIMKDLLHEVKELRQAHGAILTLLQTKLANKNDEKKNEKAPVDISEELSLDPYDFADNQGGESLFKDISPGRNGLDDTFQNLMRWLGIVVDFSQGEQRDVHMVLPRVQLSKSLDDKKKGKKGPIYSPAQIRFEHPSIVQAEIRDKWPKNVPDLIYGNMGMIPPNITQNRLFDYKFRK
ncbi:hypothetical protein F4819DRAFT_123611 [Hypoxylon fuscum]|nr:hypothetical protein F4819DRAFT_123611 [Hypoxylon fuscum]